MDMNVTEIEGRIDILTEDVDSKFERISAMIDKRSGEVTDYYPWEDGFSIGFSFENHNFPHWGSIDIYPDRIEYMIVTEQIISEAMIKNIENIIKN